MEGEQTHVGWGVGEGFLGHVTSRFGLEERATWMEESCKNVLGRKEVHDGKTEGEHR